MPENNNPFSKILYPLAPGIDLKELSNFWKVCQSLQNQDKNASEENKLKYEDYVNRLAVLSEDREAESYIGMLMVINELEKLNIEYTDPLKNLQEKAAMYSKKNDNLAEIYNYYYNFKYYSPFAVKEDNEHKVTFKIPEDFSQLKALISSRGEQALAYNFIDELSRTLNLQELKEINHAVNRTTKQIQGSLSSISSTNSEKDVLAVEYSKLTKHDELMLHSDAKLYLLDHAKNRIQTEIRKTVEENNSKDKSNIEKIADWMYSVLEPFCPNDSQKKLIEIQKLQKLAREALIDKTTFLVKIRDLVEKIVDFFRKEPKKATEVSRESWTTKVGGMNRSDIGRNM